MTKPRAVVYGLKPIGQLIAKVALEKGIELVGAIGIDPSKVGRDVGELIGIKSGIGVRVEGMPDKVLNETKPMLYSTQRAPGLIRSTPSWLRQLGLEPTSSPHARPWLGRGTGTLSWLSFWITTPRPMGQRCLAQVLTQASP
ncbi:MAG: hypothetical protein RXQ94_07175 [Caldivirga sp.]